MKRTKNGLSSRERAKQCKRWRKERIAEAAGRKSKWLRQFLCVCICLESTYAVRQYYQEQNLEFQVFRVEEDYHMEWVKEGDFISGQTFGIRLNPERMEVEIYHQTQELQEVTVPDGECSFE